MKKKVKTILITLLTVASMVPIVAQASESWKYGYNASRYQWYNHYYNSNYRHYGTITYKGLTYLGPTAKPGVWSNLNMDCTGPYSVSYGKVNL